ncbi:MAG: hypothetical protein IPM02_19945 [Betaproteobacteria bacterium]|nr:hypothetical protein [Betaproteobacteria bacterium]
MRASTVGASASASRAWVNRVVGFARAVESAAYRQRPRHDDLGRQRVQQVAQFGIGEPRQLRIARRNRIDQADQFADRVPHQRCAACAPIQRRRQGQPHLLDPYLRAAHVLRRGLHGRRQRARLLRFQLMQRGRAE